MGHAFKLSRQRDTCMASEGGDAVGATVVSLASTRGQRTATIVFFFCIPGTAVYRPEMNVGRLDESLLTHHTCLRFAICSPIFRLRTSTQSGSGPQQAKRTVRGQVAKRTLQREGPACQRTCTTTTFHELCAVAQERRNGNFCAQINPVSFRCRFLATFAESEVSTESLCCRNLCDLFPWLGGIRSC